MPAPSLRYRMEAVRGEMRTGRIEYILGLNTRSESRDCRGYCDGDPTQPGALRFEYGPLRAVIHNHDLHYCFQLDLEARVYTASRIDEHGAMRRIRSKPMSERRSGRTVQIHTQTVDTGEHREMFGHTARRGDHADYSDVRSGDRLDDLHYGGGRLVYRSTIRLADRPSPIARARYLAGVG